MTRPSATSGSPQSSASRRDEVPARRKGSKLLSAAWTPVASLFPWYVVQLEPKPEALGTGLDPAAPAGALPTVDAVTKEQQPKQQSEAAVTPAPTAGGALNRLRTPRPKAASRAA